jgi:hypothetical protein
VLLLFGKNHDIGLETPVVGSLAFNVQLNNLIAD